ncbi:hypothetical protein NKI54_29390 [Mesorhizobium sp. M0663]|uniref:hypothetical protein n=1 Tax=unclassified Mesorhizobium TaxID=325217 RepID=UPI003338B602
MHAEKIAGQDDDLERDVDAVIAFCNGDARAPVRALIVQVAHLEREIQYFRVAVSSGFSRQWHHKRWEIETDAGRRMGELSYQRSTAPTNIRWRCRTQRTPEEDLK